MAENRSVNRNDSLSLLGDLDIRETLARILNSKWQVLAVTLLAVGLSALYVFSISPTYITSALIQVDSQLGSANSMQQMLGNLDSTFSSGGTASPADIEIALLKSRFILESVIETLKLNVSIKPRYFPLIGSGIARHNEDKGLVKPYLGLNSYAWGGEEIQLDEFDSDDFVSEATLRLVTNGEHYSIYMPDGSQLLQGKVGELVETPEGRSPHARVLISKIIANSGANFNISVKHVEDVLMGLAQNLTITDLGDRTKTKTGVLQLALKGKNPDILPQILTTIINFAVERDIEKKSAEASKTLDFLNRQLPNVRDTLENAETDLNGYRSQSGKIDISQEAKIILMQLSTIEQSIAELKLKKIELLQELTLEHPYIKALSQKQLQLQKEMLILEKKIRGLPETDQKALSLERDVKVKDQLYLLLLNKVQQLQVIKAGTLSDIRVLSQATVPIEPLPMHKHFILLIGTFAGLFLGIAQVLFRDFFRRGITDTELVEKRLGIPTYAVVLFSDKQRQFNRELKKKSAVRRSFILAQSAPHDMAVEGVRGLRTMLQFTQAESKNNLICILGASPHIGKSFISINLTQMLADAGQRVLLIDADLHKGRINQHFCCDKSPGLTEILMGTVEPDATIKKITGAFDFIPTGSYTHKPTELLMTDQFIKLIERLAPLYDKVVIDTAPVLAVSDGIIIARHAATNLMIVGMGVNRMDELEILSKRLDKNGIKIAGLVFNDGVNLRKSNKQYNYYYAYDAS